MYNKINLSISVPSSKSLDRTIAFRLKHNVANEPSEYKMPSKIFAVSDIEGNFMAFRRILIKNRVINNKYAWTFGDGHLVITGDCFDRGEHVTECLWLIYSLEESAKRHGGYVHFILGNHEVMNMNGDWRYVHPKYSENTGSRKPSAALYGGNVELWRWLCTKNIMEKIGNVLFVHGGISEQLLKFNIPISHINNTVRPFYTKANESFDDPLLATVFNSKNSPFWYRGYYQPDFNLDLLNHTMNHYNVNFIVTGHTVVDQITSYFNGRVININTDHSTNNSGALLIKNNKFYRVDSNGKRDRIE